MNWPATVSDPHAPGPRSFRLTSIARLLRLFSCKLQPVEIASRPRLNIARAPADTPAPPNRQVQVDSRPAGVAAERGAKLARRQAARPQSDLLRRRLRSDRFPREQDETSMLVY